MIDQALDSAQTLGQGKQMSVLEEAPRSFEIGFQDDCDDSAEPAHLLAREIVLPMGF
jgi:hypothetical protein